MDKPADHAALLCRHDFAPHPAARLDEKQRAMLKRYGRWLEALAQGAIRPRTPDQERFVQTARGERAAESPFESAWLEHCRACDLDRGDRPPAVDPLETEGRLSRLAEARGAARALHAEYQAEREAVLEQVRGRLEALDRAYRDLLASADAEVARREDEVRQAVLRLGQTTQHPGVQAVFCRGRVSWDARGLERFAEDHPEVGEFRRVGAPSVRIVYREPK
jgi:uncharacterized protein YifE (UPF0438 family)